MPSEAEFVEAVVEFFVPRGSSLSYRLKADSLYEALSDPEADGAGVAEAVVC